MIIDAAAILCVVGLAVGQMLFTVSSTVRSENSTCSRFAEHTTLG